MRTTTGSARHKSKKRLFKRAKGFRGGRSKLTRTVKETLLRSGAYAFRDRRAKKRDFRKLWIIRLNAAARQHDIRYSEFIFGLKLAGIELDRKTLSEMAIHDEAGFKDVCDAVKAALATAPQPKHAEATA
ncbi:50S ribosomal protein L20 [Rubripirellula lacrimiformis]|uniref:Large ribosomal subunit protein bL20 n=1 Tax=Rubripirellula lacrimiformis TaxID=1930273 RepID=A0A517NER2_9BACT|nr:50S ribosomal protein L20 [Rubripirellula lacrimiformis]QDT05610.1 50S ribosomal protein L20 [Rubripirellula lacrimiformis]